MNFSKREIGKLLKNELSKGYDINRISNWADNFFYKNRDRLNNKLDEILKNIIFMAAGPEFFISEADLYQLADELIKEGEKEELSKDIPEIKDNAIELAEHWVMCPLCQESWEISSNYPMVFCPKCDQKLHNPKFKS